MPRFLARPLSYLALSQVSSRTKVAWRSLDQRPTISEIKLPLLLIHGDADTVVPIHLSDDISRRFRGELEYHRIVGAEHIESWNKNPDAYESWVIEFVRRYIPIKQTFVSEASVLETDFMHI